MKKMFALTLVCALTLSLIACGGAPAASSPSSTPAASSAGSPAQKVFQIGFTTAAVENDPYYVFAKNFSDLVSERTKGSIRIDLMGGGQLGQERPQLGYGAGPGVPGSRVEIVHGYGHGVSFWLRYVAP